LKAKDCKRMDVKRFSLDVPIDERSSMRSNDYLLTILIFGCGKGENEPFPRVLVVIISQYYGFDAFKHALQVRYEKIGSVTTLIEVLAYATKRANHSNLEHETMVAADILLPALHKQGLTTTSYLANFGLLANAAIKAQSHVPIGLYRLQNKSRYNENDLLFGMRSKNWVLVQWLRLEIIGSIRSWKSMIWYIWHLDKTLFTIEHLPGILIILHLDDINQGHTCDHYIVQLMSKNLALTICTLTDFPILRPLVQMIIQTKTERAVGCSFSNQLVDACTKLLPTPGCPE